jgi:histidinol phosphatase-like enzyme (inositol monophosphatase family)
MMPTETLRELRDFAADLAWQAGKLTLHYFQTGLTPDLKADQTPVTVADRASERLLRELIEARYPAHSILGEEEGETRPGASYRWILDPIDGTKTFVRGVPLYAVLVGLERDGEPIVGAINLPVLDELLVAARGEGCLWNGRRARVSNVAALRDSLLLCSDAESMARYGRAAAYRRLVAATRMQRTWGDAYGYALVATGRAEVMLDPQMSIWDCAALLPVLEEAGGTFTDWSGTPTIHAGEAIATNRLVLAEVLQLVGEREEDDHDR